ncbi:hypothetical protein M1567_02905 [Candidatus Marsarchaeota archaeon]|jgi:hypothetical protein|nr:hypothetical protein [Candidatus Marsarchaeota archaeon]
MPNSGAPSSSIAKSIKEHSANEIIYEEAGQDMQRMLEKLWLGSNLKVTAAIIA